MKYHQSLVTTFSLYSLVICIIIAPIHVNGQLLRPLMSFAGSLSNLNPFQSLAQTLASSSTGTGGLLRGLRTAASTSQKSSSSAPSVSTVAPVSVPMAVASPVMPFAEFGDTSEASSNSNYDENQIPMLTALELAEIMNAQLQSESQFASSSNNNNNTHNSTKLSDNVN